MINSSSNDNNPPADQFSGANFDPINFLNNNASNNNGSFGLRNMGMSLKKPQKSQKDSLLQSDQDQFPLQKKLSSNQTGQKEIILSKSKIKFIQKGEGQSQPSAQKEKPQYPGDSQFSYTMKEVTEQQKQQQRANSNFKYGRRPEAQFNEQFTKSQNENPFKNLTTVNVVQNVVNYNIGTQQQQMMPNMQNQKRMNTQQNSAAKNQLSRSFVSNNDYNMDSDEDEGEEQEDFDNRLEGQLEPVIQLQSQSKQQQIKNYESNNAGNTVVEEFQVEVVNPQQLMSMPPDNSEQKKNPLDQLSDYDYYSEEDESQKKEQQPRKVVQLTSEEVIVSSASKQQDNQNDQQQSQPSEIKQAQQEEEEEEEEEKELVQKTNKQQNMAGQQQLNKQREEQEESKQPSRRLQEVNPNNKVRANSTINYRQKLQKEGERSTLDQSVREDNEIRQQERFVKQQTSNRDLTLTQNSHSQLDGSYGGFDDCFKIKPLVLIRDQDQQEECKRIPNFPLAVRKEEQFNQYLNMLLYDVGSKQLLLQPIPFECGMLHFEIIRKKSGFNVLHPSFHLYLEKGEERVSLLFAKKRPFNKTANFLISQEKVKSSRSGDEVLGKLRGNENKERYYLYNNGENPKNVHKTPLAGIRNEYMAIQYKYSPCSIGKLRKAKVIIPGMDPETGKAKEWKPLKKEDTMLKKIEDPNHVENYYCFVDNPPQWNPKTNGYHYDFKGRISEASVKNFQMIPYQDGQKGVNIRGFCSQFGRVSDQVFKLDAQYPFSIFQAFGLALTVFDCE